MKFNLKKFLLVKRSKLIKVVTVLSSVFLVFVLTGVVMRHYIHVAIYNAGINLLDTQIATEFVLSSGKKADLKPLTDIFKYYSDGYEAIYIIPESGTTITLFEDELSQEESLSWDYKILRLILNFFIFEDEEFIQAMNYNDDDLYMSLVKVKGDFYIKLQKTIPNNFFVGDIALFKNVSLYLLPIIKPLIGFTCLFASGLLCVIALIFWGINKIFISPIIKLNKDVEEIINKKEVQTLKVNSHLASICNRDAVKLVDNLNILLQYLRKVNNSSKEFINEVVHETKNPINNIINLAELNKELYPETTEDMDLIIQQSLTASSVLDGLRDASELIMYEDVPESGDLNPVPILEQLINDYSAIHVDKQFQLDIVPNFQHHIGMTEKMFKLIVVNILSNAIKFAEPNTPISISVLLNEWNWVEIVIKNKGPEIPRDQQVKIYEKYYRIDSIKNKYSGSGLGLWLVKQIIDMHGCYIFAKTMHETTGFTLILRPADYIITTENKEAWTPRSQRNKNK